MAQQESDAQTGMATPAALRRFISAALAEQRIGLALQPIVQSRAPDRVAFCEGLIRLLDRQGRPMTAGMFIGAAEGSALGSALDCRALSLGLDALAVDPGLRLSINISAQTTEDAEWHRILEQGLARDATLAERLILEITERSMIDRVDRMAAFVLRMQRLGLSVALDDFGSGYTSFRHFKDIRFDILKIDGIFTRAIHSDADNRALVRSMRDVAQHFEMLCVAECVETPQEAACLSDLGIDALQGFHFGRPTLRDLPSEQVGQYSA
ncbi:MAG: EAL domain-containing protein [Pseudomonadota bacterium]